MKADSLSSQLIIIAAAILLALAVTLSPLHHSLDNWLRDHMQYLVADEMYFADTVVLDIDDLSLKKLEPHVGNWPFSREVYASILQFLADKGAKQVIFDILFAESREGDAAFLDKLRQHDLAILAAGTSNTSLELSLKEKADLQAISWKLDGEVPVKIIQSLVVPKLTDSDDSKPYPHVGIISASSDPDGVLRKLSLLYQLDNVVIPSLPLKVAVGNIAEVRVNYDSQSSLMTVGQLQLPVDREGRLYINFPKNPNSILAVSFHEIAERALGISEVDDIGDFFRNKTVFIGSTAYLSDRVNTPRGHMSGTYLLATALETMKNSVFIKPDNLFLNAVLIVLAGLPALWFLLRKSNSLLHLTLISSVSLFSVFGINFFMLDTANQASNSLFPFELLFFLTSLIILYDQVLVKAANLDLKRKQQELIEVANKDTLTGLFNRRAFGEEYKKELERVRRRSIPLPSVAIMDLDHFKSVNDTYGHDIGDDVLRVFSEVLKSTVRSIDVPARWGGEEFVVLLPATLAEDGAMVLDRVRREISQRDIPDGKGAYLNVTVSIGVAPVDSVDLTMDNAVKNADQALYEAKETGRNQVICAKAQ